MQAASRQVEIEAAVLTGVCGEELDTELRAARVTLAQAEQAYRDATTRQEVVKQRREAFQAAQQAIAGQMQVWTANVRWTMQLAGLCCMMGTLEVAE